jgi:hypothetical protein
MTQYRRKREANKEMQDKEVLALLAVPQVPWPAA